MQGYNDWKRTKAKNFAPPGFYGGGGHVRAKPGQHSYDDEVIDGEGFPEFDREESSGCYDDDMKQYLRTNDAAVVAETGGQTNNILHAHTLDAFLQFYDSEAAPKLNESSKEEGRQQQSDQDRSQLLQKLRGSSLTLPESDLQELNIDVIRDLIARVDDGFFEGHSNNAEESGANSDDSEEDFSDMGYQRVSTTCYYDDEEEIWHPRILHDHQRPSSTVDNLPLDCWNVILDYSKSLLPLVRLSDTSMWLRELLNDSDVWRRMWRQSAVYFAWHGDFRVACFTTRSSQFGRTTRHSLPRLRDRSHPWSWHSSLRFSVVSQAISFIVGSNSSNTIVKHTPKELSYYLKLQNEVDAAAYLDLLETTSIPYAQQWARIQINRALGMYNVALNHLQQFDLNGPPQSALAGLSELGIDDIRAVIAIPRPQEHQKFMSALRLRSLDSDINREIDLAAALEGVIDKLVVLHETLVESEDSEQTALLTEQIESLELNRRILLKPKARDTASGNCDTWDATPTHNVSPKMHWGLSKDVGKKLHKDVHLRRRYEQKFRTTPQGSTDSVSVQKQLHNVGWQSISWEYHNKKRRERMNDPSCLPKEKPKGHMVRGK